MVKADVKLSDVDLIKELRLRRWARCHYVPPQQRELTWHPIVLDEMQKRDAEFDSVAIGPGVGTLFVPLPPTDQRRFDASHAAVSEPVWIREQHRPVTEIETSWPA